MALILVAASKHCDFTEMKSLIVWKGEKPSPLLHFLLRVILAIQIRVIKITAPIIEPAKVYTDRVEYMLLKDNLSSLDKTSEHQSLVIRNCSRYGIYTITLDILYVMHRLNEKNEKIIRDMYVYSMSFRFIAGAN